MLSKNDTYRKIFSNNLNYYMQINGKIQDDLVRDLGLKSSTISSWCNGQKLPRMDKINLLANYFGIHFSKLIEEKNDDNYFEFISEDDAMFPLLDAGDIALIYKQDKLDDILTPNKGTYLIKLADKNTIRKIELNDDKTSYILTAMNAYYKVIQIPKDDFYLQIQILGKVIKAENKSAFK
ncbi:MAG: helix-turn-helix domain-containing protein [Clostridia bacterium]|nr:helix-turn-helix domain-containing protein [Clostridia bacterium]